MNTRFYNGKILTLENEFEILDAELWVKDNRVYYVGCSRESDLIFDREIDLNGNLLMPGFKNAHTHSAMTFLRSYADDLSLHDWLNNAIFPMEAKLKDNDIYWLSKLAIMEYLTSGITACFDMYLNDDEMVRAGIDTGFRVVINSSLNNFTTSLDKVENNYNKYNSYNDLISYKLGFHAEYTTDIGLLKGMAKLCNKYKTGVYTHCSETITEVENCKNKYGKTPVALFNELGMFEYSSGLYHGIYLDDNDIEIIKNKGVGVATNPSSNCKLASGIAPVSRLIDNNINVAIGTDGPAGNNALDMFREMYLATALQKLILKDATALDADSVLKMATVNGAKFMGLVDCDTLAVGKKADLIVIDMSRPNMQPINNVVKNLVYSGSKDNIKLTMVNGRVLYEDRQWNISEDPEKVYFMANKIINEKR